jgi:CheY-like chemotaxis protein
MIALTGYGQAEDVDRSREAGFDHHFVKPADPRAIQEAIEASSAQRPREGLRTSL